MYSQKVLVTNASGLHARPANIFTNAAGKFKSQIFIEANGKKVVAKSIIGVMTLGAKKGTEVTIYAEGVDEVEAVTSLVNLIETGLNE